MLVAALLVGRLDPADDGAGAALAGRPSLTLEHVVLKQPEERFHRGVIPQLTRHVLSIRCTRSSSRRAGGGVSNHRASRTALRDSGAKVASARRDVNWLVVTQLTTLFDRTALTAQTATLPSAAECSVSQTLSEPVVGRRGEPGRRARPDPDELHRHRNAVDANSAKVALEFQATIAPSRLNHGENFLPVVETRSRGMPTKGNTRT